MCIFVFMINLNYCKLLNRKMSLMITELELIRASYVYKQHLHTSLATDSDNDFFYNFAAMSICYHQIDIQDRIHQFMKENAKCVILLVLRMKNTS